jgi:hypothetical protein
MEFPRLLPFPGNEATLLDGGSDPGGGREKGGVPIGWKKTMKMTGAAIICFNDSVTR